MLISTTIWEQFTRKKGLDDKALIEYKEAINLDNSYAQPHNNLGNIYFNRGLIDKARAEYEEALRIKPDHALAHNGLGNVYNATGELDKAMEEFKKSLFTTAVTFMPEII